MATTVGAAFDELKRNLEITGIQGETVSSRQQAVREAMEGGFTVIDSFLTGSYARSTMIAPLAKADIDIFVVLDAGYFRAHTPASLLGLARDILRRRYPRTPEIQPDGQAVTITFDDFCVDVVPAFYRQGGGFLIPDTRSGTWLATDPARHKEAIAAANQAHAGHLVPLIKMMKAWNRNAGACLTGFYVELLTSSVLNGVTVSSYPSAVRFVLDKGREAVRRTQMDPAGMGNQVQGLRAGKSVEGAVAVFNEAYNLALMAEGSDTHGYTRTACDSWRRLFGEPFPSYG